MARDGIDPIVVTGAHRSGTTVLGDVVTKAADTWTVWEPFNRHWGLREVDLAYPYLSASDANSPELVALDHYLATGRGEWSAKTILGPLGTRLRAARKTSERRRLWEQNWGRTPVVKDPFALLSLTALQTRTTSRPIIVAVRHPCSWILSLQRMSWPAGPELNDLIRQRQLYDTFLSDILPSRDWTTADDITTGALAWRCLYGMVFEQVRAGARILLVPLEAFSTEAVQTMRLMFSTLALEEPQDLRELARAYTSASKTVTPEGSTKHLLQRDSRALSAAWHDKLTSAEIATIRTITEDVFGNIYDDWQSGTAEPQLLSC